MDIEETNEATSMERTKPTLPQTIEDPTFYFPQILWLYENAFDIDQQKIEELLSLERSLLIADLETVIYDAVKRYDYFSGPKSGEAKTDFCLHALILLKELEAAESLAAVLELLRQPGEALDFWLGDTVTENIWQVVYMLGKDQLSVLEAFLKEPLNHAFARGAVSNAILQSGLHDPEQRPEILDVYKRLLLFYDENKANPEIIDPIFLGLLISDLIDLEAMELAGEIKILYDNDLVDETVNGDWEEVKGGLNGTNPELKNEAAKRPVQNIFEIYEYLKTYYSEQPDNDEGDEWDFDEEEEELKEGTLFYASHTPYVREDEKVGRNDPCPCGSGLKYKKCHGK